MFAKKTPKQIRKKKKTLFDRSSYTEKRLSPMSPTQSGGFLNWGMPGCPSRHGFQYVSILN